MPLFFYVVLYLILVLTT